MAAGGGSPDSGGDNTQAFIDRLIRELPAMTVQAREAYLRILEEQRKKKN